MLRLLTLCLTLWAVLAVAAPTAVNFHLAQNLKLIGDDGWDYLAFDSSSRRLYITRGVHVSVLDADTWQPVGDLSGLDGAHGVAVVPELKLVYVTSGKSNTVHVFDTSSFKQVAQIGVDHKPDAIVFDAKTKRVFAFNDESKTASVIDTGTNKVVGTIELGGKPEFAVSNGAGVVYDNLEDKNEIVKIDAATMKVLAHFSVAPCDSPSGLAIDANNRRLFAVCDNKLMAVINTDNGKIVKTVAIGEGPDAVAFDEKNNLIFVPNGKSGTLTVVKESTPNKFDVLSTVPTKIGARTLAFDTKTQHVVSVTAEFGPPAKAIPANPHTRAPIRPGSVSLLVIEKQ